MTDHDPVTGIGDDSGIIARIRQDPVPAMSPDTIGRIRELEAVNEALPQALVPTSQVLFAGVYARTVRIPAGVVLTGAEIRVDTVLVINGHATFGGDVPLEICGCQVIKARAPRKAAIIAHDDTDLTMVFATSASTLEEAEEEFTHEADRLLTRKGKL